jgi:hypothetical protein
LNHILDLEKESGRLQHDIFSKIVDGNTVLLLGAGASVGEKRYLSKEIIQYYSEYKAIPELSQDIIEFVDILSKTPGFSRNEFDGFVNDLVGKLSPTVLHESIIDNNWKEIITTNFDLLVERAFDALKQKRKPTYDLKVTRNITEYAFNPANTEIKYVKLNGCASDLGKFPFVFSTDDFDKAARFYKQVLQSFRSLSENINVLSIGYSFTDLFSKHFFERFDKLNRNKRWIYSIDPYVKDEMLPYFASKKIAVIRCTGQEFFEKLNQWQAANHDAIISAKRINFLNPKNETIQLSRKTKINLDGCLVQLAEHCPAPAITASEYYQGSEPTFDVVKKGLDVIRKKEVETIKNKFLEVHNNQKESIPIFAIEGSFGVGKSTFCYRLIGDILGEGGYNFLAIQIIDSTRIRINDVAELVRGCGTKNIVFLFTGIEVDSRFKDLAYFRNLLNKEQFTGFHISIICSIRTNILNRFFSTSAYRDFYSITLPDTFTEAELADLVEKLNSAHVITVRDVQAKAALVQKIMKNYSGDALLALIDLVSSGYHDRILRDAISQLTKKSKLAFLYTSLLYQYSIRMPAGLARELISKDWEEFKEEVLEYDGKGILIQEDSNEKGLNSDIYLRTRHPIISQKIVALLLPTEDDKYREYLILISKLVESYDTSRLIVDLLKGIRFTEELSPEKVDGLFDAASKVFETNSHFNIQYAINLQNRGTEKDIQNGLQILTYVDSLQDKLKDVRNHRITHRKACLNFALARLKSEQTGEDVSLIIAEAKDLFEIKMALDPQSFYSYSDYLKMLLWQLKISDEGRAKQLSELVEFENTLNKALDFVEDRLDEILKIKSEYLLFRNEKYGNGDKKYLQFLEQISMDESLAHISAILKFNYYESLGDFQECEKIIMDIEQFSRYDSSLKMLVKYYGKRLQYRHWRDRLLELVKTNSRIEKLDSLRFHYYSMIMYAYMNDFYNCNIHADVLRELNHFFNPEFIEYWKENDNNADRVFEGVVIQKANGMKVIKIPIFQQTFLISKYDYKSTVLQENKPILVKIRFQINGIRCDIIPPSAEETNTPPLKNEEATRSPNTRQ